MGCFQKFQKDFKKHLTNRNFNDIICRHENIAELCNGSTADSDSVCWGSNPYSAAKEKRPSSDGLFSLLLGCGDSNPNIQEEEAAFAKGEVSRLCIPPLGGILPCEEKKVITRTTRV